MIDNFKQVESLFFFNKANGICFFVEVIAENIACLINEDNPYRTVATYFVRDVEHLRCIKDEIILMCNHLKARAFIDIRGYYINDINYSMLRSLAMENLNTDIDHRDPTYFLNKGIRLALPVRRRVMVTFYTEDINKVRESIKLMYGDNVHIEAEVSGVNLNSLIVELKDLVEIRKCFPNVVTSERPVLLYLPDSLDVKKP